MKILVIEDERIILKTVERYLQNKGHDVTAVGDGMAGLTKIKEHAFDLIFLDLTLPFISGVELLSKVRNELNLKVPVIVVSTVGLKTSVKEIMDLGANGFINKPFHLEELSKTINTHFASN